MVSNRKERDGSAWGFFTAMTIIFFLAAVSAPLFSEEYFVEYSISGKSCEIVNAVTPYDYSEQTRKVFTKWFKRGVETVLSEEQPIDIEWQPSSEGHAGRNGYETDLHEGEACLKEIKKTGKLMNNTRKSPIEFFD